MNHSEWEKMFRTQGHVYVRNRTSGLWDRIGKECIPKIYVGSIDAEKNHAIGERTYNPGALILQIVMKDVPGFVPFFERGNSPLGIVCDLEDVLSFGADYLELKDDSDFFYQSIIHVGTSIEEVYQSWNPDLFLPKARS